MNGQLKKVDNKWFVSRSVGDGVKETWEELLEVYPKNVESCFLKEGYCVDFEIVHDGQAYAKLDLEEDDDDNNYCNTCNGSGEGMWDGSRCSSCNGLGRILHDSDDFEEPNYPPDDFHEYEIKGKLKY